MPLFLFQLEHTPWNIRLFPFPSAKLRGINAAERLVPKALLTGEELLLFQSYRTIVTCNSFEASF
jgi:hypothetical protein